jgi:hypothetical protein
MTDSRGTTSNDAPRLRGAVAIVGTHVDGCGDFSAIAGAEEDARVFREALFLSLYGVEGKGKLLRRARSSTRNAMA